MSESSLEQVVLSWPGVQTIPAITLTEARVLLLIAKSSGIEGTTIASISNGLGISASTAKRSLSSLRKKRLISTLRYRNGNKITLCVEAMKIVTS